MAPSNRGVLDRNSSLGGNERRLWPRDRLSAYAIGGPVTQR